MFSDAEDFDGEHGIIAYNRTEQEKGKASAFLPMQEWIVAVGKHPGLIPSGQWIRVQESLERNKFKGYRKPRSNEALLTGVLFCACGERMYPKLTRRKNAEGERIYSYVCRMKERSRGERCSVSNLNGNGMDQAVLERIGAFTEDGQYFLERIRKCRRFFADNGAHQDDRIEALRAELAENERKLEGLIDSMSLLGDSGAKMHIVRRMEQLYDVNRGIEGRILELQELEHAGILGEEEFDLLRQSLVDFCETVNGMSLEETRAAVRAVVRRVIWDGANAHVLFSGTEDDESDEVGKARGCEDSK